MIPIILWIVEDDTVYRRTLRQLLSREESIINCRAFPSCIELFDALDTSEEQPEIILMDLGLPDMGGVEGIQKLAVVAPDITVIVLTVHKDKEKVMDALDAGAAGYLLKSATVPEIIRGIQAVFFGGSVLSPSIAKVVLDEVRKPTKGNTFKLSAREIEVLEQLAQGLSIQEIANVLEVRRRTIAFHLEKIYSKLQVQSQSGAVAKALRSGVIK